MEIMLGNRARITRARVTERATGLLLPPPLHALGFLAATWDMCQGLESQQAGVTHPPTCREVKAHPPSHLYLWKILAGNVVILTLKWGCAWGRPGCCSLVSFHQSLERTAHIP